MYLHKKTYVKKWSHDKPEEQVNITLSGNEKKIKGINTEKVVYIEEEVAYWRKANMIHEWVVKNCVSSEDFHGEDTYVSRKDLKELYDTCQKVIDGSKLVEGKVKNGETYDSEKKEWVGIMEDGKYIEDSSVAEELLPTSEGFFFGSQDYNEWYLNDIIYTRDTLKPIVEGEEDFGEYYYSASW